MDVINVDLGVGSQDGYEGGHLANRASHGTEPVPVQQVADLGAQAAQRGPELDCVMEPLTDQLVLQRKVCVGRELDLGGGEAVADGNAVQVDGPAALLALVGEPYSVRYSGDIVSSIAFARHVERPVCQLGVG